MENTVRRAPTAVSTTVVSPLRSSTTAWNATDDARIVSPSTMIVNRP